MAPKNHRAMKAPDKLYLVHCLITRVISAPMNHDEQLARLEAVEEHLKNHRNAAAVGVSPPPGLAAAILSSLRAAMPPERLAQIVAKLPERERLQLAALFAEPPVRRTMTIIIAKPKP